jgi:GSH-dependent disulfide-bond oxidoreductase
MIDAYVWTTPNGYKALVLLEEMGVPYTPQWVDLTKGEQLRPEYLAINPNGKIPRSSIAMRA